MCDCVIVCLCARMCVCVCVVCVYGARVCGWACVRLCVRVRAGVFKETFPQKLCNVSGFPYKNMKSPLLPTLTTHYTNHTAL